MKLEDILIIPIKKEDINKQPVLLRDDPIETAEFIEGYKFLMLDESLELRLYFTEIGLPNKDMIIEGVKELYLKFMKKNHEFWKLNDNTVFASALHAPYAIDIIFKNVTFSSSDYLRKWITEQLCNFSTKIVELHLNK